jgi:cell fate regulator YaaT (PSP1 superfamily)
MNECRRKLVRVAVGLLNRETVIICPDQFDCPIGAFVIVSRAYGLDWGKIVGTVADDDSEITESALRLATEEDLIIIDDSGATEDDIYDFNEYTRECDLFMRLVGVDHSFDRSKVTFYYIAEGRVDFRELVKKLNKKYQRRVELYQLNLEDQFEKFATCGVCGIEVCCRKMKGVFGMKVSSRICKDQKLVYNPLKMSGCCGKARCCYVFEHPNYIEFADTLPKIGGRLVFRGHEWKLADWDIFRQAILLYHPDYGRDIAVPWDEFKQHYGKSIGEPLDLYSIFGAPPPSRDRYGAPIANGLRKTSEQMQGVSERYETALQSDNPISISNNDSIRETQSPSYKPEPNYHRSFVEPEEAKPSPGNAERPETAPSKQDHSHDRQIRPGQAIRNAPRNKPRPVGKPPNRTPPGDDHRTGEHQPQSQTAKHSETKEPSPNQPLRNPSNRAVRRNVRPFRPPRRPGS